MPDLRVSVLGAAGFAGGELLRLLAAHPAVGSLRAFSASHAGRPWSDVHLPFRNVPGGRFEQPDPGAAAAADVVFLALPHGESQRLVPRLLKGDPGLVVDLAADFRLADPATFALAYGEHRAPGLLGEFTYALADVLGAGLAGHRRLATPGCFATAVLLALVPFAEAGLLAGPPVAFAVTGSTGAGARPRRTTHHPFRAHGFTGYAREGHRHRLEIGEQLAARGGPREVRLLVHAAPLVRGIHATVHARLARPVPRPLDLLAERWQGRPFVHVTPAPPELPAVVGTNHAHVHATPLAGGREVVVDVAIDNLVKGAAGQAVQATNLALGLPETLGLEHPGFAPC